MNTFFLILGIAVGAVIVIGYLLTMLDFAERARAWFRRYVRKRPDPTPATADDIARVEAKLQELQNVILAPPPGAPPLDTSALALRATGRTIGLIEEALELQAQHKEREAIDRVLTAYDFRLPAGVKARVHILAANGFLRLTSLEEAEAHYRQARDLARQSPDPDALSAALVGLGLISSTRGEMAVAEELFSEALVLCKSTGNLRGQAWALLQLGVTHEQKREFDKAEEYLREALALSDELGDEPGRASALGNLGVVRATRGDRASAAEYYEKALKIHESHGDRLGRGRGVNKSRQRLYSQRRPGKWGTAARGGPFY